VFQLAVTYVKLQKVDKGDGISKFPKLQKLTGYTINFILGPNFAVIALKLQTFGPGDAHAHAIGDRPTVTYGVGVSV